MNRTPRIRRSLLALALGTCLSTLAITPVLAQSSMGAVAGRANAGDQIVLVNTATGATRTVTTDADGSYRASQLPIGDYSLRVVRAGQNIGEAMTVSVALGGTTTVNLGSDGDVVNLDKIVVTGDRIVNRVDVFSVESATNITREEWARLPVAQSLGSVALLAPGVISGNSSFGGISFGGSSVAENSVYINGLNVTDFYRRQSWSSAPFAFFQEFQVKTGGYSAEFGRSTGGVINAVTRSGSNEFQGGVEMTFEPTAWKWEADDHYFDQGGDSATYRGSRDSSSFIKTNLWASGPIVKDRLFLFAMYENRDASSHSSDNDGTEWYDSSSENGFWGAKLDWRITDNHLLELLGFSDKSDALTSTYNYNWDAETIGSKVGDGTDQGGGDNASITYTGYFGESFVAKAMYGVNQSRALAFSPADSLCDQIFYDSSYGDIYEGMGSPALGCYPGSGSVVTHEDEREVGRLDFEWTLGNHLLRFGVDHEKMTTDRHTLYPGSGMRYTAYVVSPGDPLDNGSAVPDGVTEILMGRKRIDGGVFDTVASAYYIEDTWSLTPRFLLNLGVRVDSFDNKTASGASFIKMDNLVAPRLGFSWDMHGDGTTKLFGNLGRYYLPVTNNINVTFAGGLIDERTFYVLDGWRQASNPVTGAPYMEPVIGSQIGGVDTSYNIIADDLRQSVDRDLDAVYQDEAILGFQSAIDQAWSWGVNATYRRMKNALDDVRINHTPCGPVGYNLWPIANPGKPLTIWGNEDIGCASEGWITIDTSTDGYEMSGSGNVVGYFTPKREYKALEFQIDRAWDGKWSMNASYLWSKLDGNHEGPVNSDTNYGDTGMVQHWDHPANNQDYGPLFNDHRHQIKFRGAYAFNDQWMLGATLTAQSGGPITALGVAWPDDSRGAASYVTIGSGGGSFWHCVQNCSGPVADRVFEYSGRGDAGRLPWIYDLGASITWTAPIEAVDLKARFSVFNLLDQQHVINVRQRYEAAPGTVRPLFGTGTRWQSPRTAQLVITLSF
ncbi:MAG TPA: TonB-dependent receptor [Chiayiivirga sp.]|nr:TonB-dependent receptor [Chiayiivirga sp.]